MIWKLLTLLFLITAIIMFLDLTPQQISDDIVSFTTPKETLRSKAHALRTGKKKKSIGERLIYTQNALTAMGKGGKFAFVVCSALVLMAAGAAVAVLIGNIFLIPTFAAFLAMIPFIYVRNSMSAYEKHIKDELETALSIITTSYTRNESLIESVKENLDYIKPPLNNHFAAFVNDATFITSTTQAIKNLKAKIDDEIFREWCDALIQCDSDSVMKDTLEPIVAKMTDVRLVNSELSTMMAEVRMEYYTMVGLVVGNVPLLYVLNKDWFHTLVYEFAGKFTLGLCGVVIFVTYLFMLKFTKPIEYKG